MRRTASSFLLVLNAAAAVVAADRPVNNRHYPVDLRRPGMAAEWNLAIDPSRQGQTQLIEVALPDGGKAELLQPSGTAASMGPLNRALFQVGATYRFQLSGLPDLPNVTVYPTVELIDHLHAPPGTEQDFPVPLEITSADVDAAAQNRLVTKVVYLEQPDLAIPEPQEGELHTTDFAASANLMKAADDRGRPIAIIRIGGRVPDARNPDPSFYSTSGAVIVTEVPGKASLKKEVAGSRSMPVHKASATGAMPTHNVPVASTMPVLAQSDPFVPPAGPRPFPNSAE